jgi:lipid-binding SYLF domain-containing protein
VVPRNEKGRLADDDATVMIELHFRIIPQELPMRFFCLVLLALSLGAPSVLAEGKDKSSEKRAKIDEMAATTLDRLFDNSSQAKGLSGSAFGYGVFSNVKISLIITGGGGSGVAVERGTGDRTYMRMGTGGLNVGLGGQKYQVVFLFETESAFRKFVDSGWQADASASAVAGKAGANAEATFHNGVALYQLTDKGLMLQADISGTKYWKADKLNK